MIRLAAAAFLLLAAGGQDSVTRAQEPTETLFAQVTINQHIVIRVPRRDDRIQASSGPRSWRETGGPRCVPARHIAGALPGQSTVDLVMRDNRRVRAHLGQRCAGLDYYRGLYVAANPDGQICAGRDVIRSRMGGQCEIVQFRMLHPARD